MKRPTSRLFRELWNGEGTINAGVGAIRCAHAHDHATYENARTAVSHYEVIRRLNNRFGKFTLLRVRIETGRTHQIACTWFDRHPVVGDTRMGERAVTDQWLTGGAIQSRAAEGGAERLKLGRNFLHAARLEFTHPGRVSC